MSLLKNVFLHLSRYALAVIFLLLCWYGFYVFFGENVVPNPIESIPLFLTSFTDPFYLENFFISLFRLCVGLGVAALIALPLGLLLGNCKIANALLSPLVFITYPLPKIVFLPVFFLLFGLGDVARVVLISLTTTYQMLVIVRATALSQDRVYENAVHFMGGTTFDTIRHVYFPQALPGFLTSVKVASGTAVAVLFLAESFATNSGLGYLIMDAWGMGDTLAMFNGILLMSFLGVLLYSVIYALEYLCCPWHTHH